MPNWYRKIYLSMYTNTYKTIYLILFLLKYTWTYIYMNIYSMELILVGCGYFYGALCCSFCLHVLFAISEWLTRNICIYAFLKFELPYYTSSVNNCMSLYCISWLLKIFFPIQIHWQNIPSTKNINSIKWSPHLI